jgi:hypothetical protein
MGEQAAAMAERRPWIVVAALLTAPLLAICTFLFFRFLPALTRIIGSFNGIRVF